MTVESPYLTLQQAADYALCCPRTVRRWLKAGLPRHGHDRPLIKRTELEAFLSPTADLSSTPTPGGSK